MDVLRTKNDPVRDEIVDRQRAEQARQESHDLLRAVVEGTSDAIFVKDLQGHYLMINTAGACFLGKTVNEVIGKDDSELFAPQTASKIMADDRRIMETGEGQSFQAVLTTSAGAMRTYFAIKSPYRDREGKVCGVLGVSRDITEQKHTEEALRASEERYRLLFERNVAGVFRSTLDGQFSTATTRSCACWVMNRRRICWCTARRSFIHRAAIASVILRSSAWNECSPAMRFSSNKKTDQ